MPGHLSLRQAAQTVTNVVRLTPRGPQKGQVEQLFLQKLQHDRAYNDMLVRLSIDTGLNDQFFRKALEPISMCCLRKAQDMLEGQTPCAQQQIKDLQKKLQACNLSAMRDISNMKAQQKEPFVKAADIDDIRFHEPLMYLDDSTRELVMLIVLDKLNQLSDRVAPPELMESLQVAAEGRLKGIRRNKAEDSDDSSDDIEELREKLKRLEEAAFQHKIAMEQMSKSLKESKDAEVQAIAALEAHKNELENIIQERLQMELARARALKFCDAQAQTDLTGHSLQEIFDAAEKMRNKCAQLRKKLAAATGTDQDEFETALRDSIDEFANAQTVFLRLWDDAILRNQGGCRRERAPANPVPPKTFMPTKVVSRPERSTEVSAASSEETIPVREESKSSYHISFALDEKHREPLRVESKPSTPPLVAEELPVLQGPKFSRQKKTVSLALLAPRARDEVESKCRHPLESVNKQSGDCQQEGAQYPPKQKSEGLLETVSGFLKQRRRMHSDDPPPLFTLPETKTEAEGQPARTTRNVSYHMSRLGASKISSSSTPALVRLQAADFHSHKGSS